MRINEFIVKELRGHVKKHINNYQAEALPKGILLLDESTAPRKDYCCITTREHLSTLIDKPELLHGVYFFLTNEGDPTLTMPIFDDTSLFETDLALVPLYNKLQNTLSRLASSSAAYVPGTQRFSDIIHDVLTTRLTRNDEILGRMQALENFKVAPYRVLLFKFRGDKGATSRRIKLINSLESLLPFQNSAVYFDTIVTVTQPATHDEDVIALQPHVQNPIEELCERFDCYCGVSSLTINWSMIRTCYLNAEFAIRCGSKMARGKKQRLFFADTYFNFMLIDFSIRGFERLNLHNNYNYMLHPGVSNLIRYDNSHGTDLLSLLYCYLRNERNITKTSAECNMHRNTVIYKIKNISTVLEDDLNDPDLRERILLSCMIAVYCKEMFGALPTPTPTEITYSFDDRS